VELGGRTRRAASASERAQQSITKTIKAKVEKIGQSDAALGDSFSRCIKTGTFCSYQPDPDFPIAWEFAAQATGSTFEPAQQRSSSDAPAPAHVDHRRASSLVLEVSLFSLAARTAFVGREAKRKMIRAVIDRALGGHGSVVIIGKPGISLFRRGAEGFR